MRTWMRWIGVVAVAAVLGACGSSGGDGSSGASEAPRSRAGATAPPTVAQLQAALLDEKDVGPAWRTAEPVNRDDLAAFAQQPCESATISPSVYKRLTAVVGTQFQPVARSYQHLIELVSTGEATRLAADLQSELTAIESCDNKPASRALASLVTVKKLAAAKLGDQQATYSILQTPQAKSEPGAALRLGFVRQGPVAVLVGLTEFRPAAQAATVSDDAFLALLAKAAAKLRTAG